MRSWIAVALLCALQIGLSLCKCSRRGIECIDYDLVSRYNDYEERQYPPLLWISTTTKGTALSRAQNILFKKLFRYIQGDNLKGDFINSTAPIRTKVIPCQEDSMCEHTYTMSFLMPSALYEEAPIPTNVDLFFEQEPAKRYIVRSFGGRPSESEWLNEAQVLADLGSKDSAVEQDHYYLNWYDPPLQLFRRLNEVWLSKNDKKLTLALEESQQINEIC